MPCAAPWLLMTPLNPSRHSTIPSSATAGLRCVCLAALLLAVTFLTGCQTTPPAADLSSPGWTVRHGQAVWKPAADETEIAGEVLVAWKDDGPCVVQFSKSPFTLVDVRVTPNRWWIEFPFRRVQADGKGPPPTRWIWFQLPALVSQQSPAPNWRLEDAQTGESLDGIWTP